MASLKRVVRSAWGVLAGLAFPCAAWATPTSVNGYADVLFPSDGAYLEQKNYYFKTKHKMDCNKTRTDQAERFELKGAGEEDVEGWFAEFTGVYISYDQNETGEKTTEWVQLQWLTWLSQAEMGAEGKCYADTWTRQTEPEPATGWVHRATHEHSFSIPC